MIHQNILSSSFFVCISMFFDMASPVRLEDKKDYCQALSNLWSPKEWFTDYDLWFVRVGYLLLFTKVYLASNTLKF